MCRTVPLIVFFIADVSLGVYRNHTGQGPNVYNLEHGIMTCAMFVTTCATYYLCGRDMQTRLKPSSALYVSCWLAAVLQLC